MPYQNLEDGLYLVSQQSEKMGIPIRHYGVLDVGNILMIQSPPLVFSGEPVIIHQTPPEVRADVLSETGSWSIEGKVIRQHLREAVERVKTALKTPSYDLFGHNCEHFARFITTGTKESKQLQKTIFTATVAAVGLGLLICHVKNSSTHA